MHVDERSSSDSNTSNFEIEEELEMPVGNNPQILEITYDKEKLNKTEFRDVTFIDSKDKKVKLNKKKRTLKNFRKYQIILCYE